MSSKITTGSLMQRVMKTSSLSRFFKQNERYLKTEDLGAWLNDICRDRNLSVSEVIQKSQIDRGYGYQIFRGIRSPSRDKLIQLALAIGLDVNETQHLLTLGGKSQLYPRLKRDAVLLYCIQNSFSVLETQDSLEEYGLSLLGDMDK